MVNIHIGRWIIELILFIWPRELNWPIFWVLYQLINYVNNNNNNNNHYTSPMKGTHTHTHIYIVVPQLKYIIHKFTQKKKKKNSISFTNWQGKKSNLQSIGNKYYNGII